ncbi:MAG TPA: PAS domain S-box protein [Desulfomonilaceae bacterium]|nr:PAS domain S-box protein [Desulfomonilaceae bacterium]
MSEKDKEFLTLTSITKDKGSPNSMGSFSDISDRKQAEQALRESEQRYRTLFEESRDGVYLTSRDGRLIDANQSFVDMFGYTREEIIGSDIADLYVDRGQRKIFQNAIEKHGSVKDYEIEFRKEDGTKIICLATSTVRKDRDGTILGYEGIIRDISDRKRAEEALRDSERRLAQIVDFLPDATFVIDSQGKVIAWNRAIEKMTGVAAKDIMGKGDYEYSLAFYPERRPVLIDLVNTRDPDFEGAMYASIQAEDDRLICETRPNTLKDDAITLWATACPLYDEHGKVVGAIESVRDITRRKKLEDEFMRDAKEVSKFQNVLLDLSKMDKTDYEAAVQEILRKDAETLGVERTSLWGVNAAFDRVECKKLYVLSEHVFEPGGMTLDANEFPRYMEALAGSRYIAADDAQNDDCTREFASLCLKPFGITSVLDVPVWLNGNVTAIVRHEHIGPQRKWREREIEFALTIAEMISLTIEASERRRAEEAVSLSEQKYHLLVDNAPVGIVSINRDGQIEEINRKLLEVLGSPSAEATKAINMLTFPSLVKAGVSEMVQRCMDDGRAITAEIPYQSKWEKASHLRVLLTPRRTATGRIHGCQAVVEDITDRKVSEELLLRAEKFRAIADLASGVAHNFNNLLQIVMGGAQVALLNLELGNVLAAKARIEQMISSSKFGSETVKRLQDFARLRSDSGREGEVFDLSKTVQQAMEMGKVWLKSEPEKEGVQINVVESLEPGCKIMGRESELFEVVVNLMKNAIEALPEGGEIRFKTSVVHDQVVLKVEDTGVGISQENLARIFEPFFTTGGTRRTGMGLASSYGIVTQHGGSISVDSRMGEGATFTVRLPLAKEPGADGGMVKTPARDPILRILLIDDLEPILTVLGDGLTQLGHVVSTALSGEDALRILRDTQVDVVICDLGMPGMNGWEVGKKIRALCEDRGIPKPPIILLTGWGAQVEEKNKMSESGVDAVVEKPVDMARLLEAIRRFARREDLVTEIPR